LPNLFLAPFDQLAALLTDVFSKFREETYH
jgi:hypothetical protein